MLLLCSALNPSAPLGDLLKTVLLLFVQGGGLAILGGTVTLNSCNIYNNEATSVSVATLLCLKSQRPAGKTGFSPLFVLFVHSM